MLLQGFFKVQTVFEALVDWRCLELHRAAIEELERLSQTQENIERASMPISANLWPQLGDLYALVALYVQAEKSYQTVLSSSEVANMTLLVQSSNRNLAREIYPYIHCTIVGLIAS